jgi:hypothetical protein
MAWIESHQELRDHPKTKKAARLLGIHVAQVLGHLHCLWWWCLDHAQDGDLTGYDTEEIADAAAWDGEGDLIAAFLTCGKSGKPGFLERTDDGELLVHDWYEYAGKLMDKRKENVKRTQEWRARNAPVMHNESITNASVLPLTVPYSTVPNSTSPAMREESREKEESPAAFYTIPSASAGRREAAAMRELNLSCPPEIRTTLANIILDIIGKRQLVDDILDTPMGTRLKNEAHQYADALWKTKKYQTEQQILDLEPKWAKDWRGKDGGGTPEQFAAFALEQLNKRNGRNGQHAKPATFKVVFGDSDPVEVTT